MENTTRPIINTEARLTAIGKAFRTGSGLAVFIPWKIIQNLNIEPGNMIEITFRHTGIINAISGVNNLPGMKKQD